MLGINQSRSWRTATLNEFRLFFGLKPYRTFEEINPDPQKAATLMHFYSHPDNVELYPGVVIEDTKSQTPGWLPPPTVTRAIFSDVMATLRGDRFYTQVSSPRSSLTVGLYSQYADTMGICYRHL